MPVILEQSESSCAIRLEGEVNITGAAELKKVLRQALESGKEMRLDLEGATELDVTALQLLWAVAREVRAKGGKFILAGQVPKEISDGVTDAGFEKFPVPPDRN